MGEKEVGGGIRGNREEGKEEKEREIKRKRNGR